MQSVTRHYPNLLLVRTFLRQKEPAGSIGADREHAHVHETSGDSEHANHNDVQLTRGNACMLQSGRLAS